MYEVLPSFVLGFHGCDRSVGENVVSGKTRLRKSANDYDWLGNGIYFWENNPQRALDFAKILKKYPERTKSKISEPFVIGAVIDLGYCLNLLDASGIKIVEQAYKMLAQAFQKTGKPLPENKPVQKEQDILLRNLDCAVIESLHEYNEQTKKKAYDAVRGAFIEGRELNPNAGFRNENHIQICVRNPNCIKGYFRVLDADENYPIP